jgi:hypothetical protein
VHASDSLQVMGRRRAPAVLLEQGKFIGLMRAVASNVRGWREFQFVVPAESRHS